MAARKKPEKDIGIVSQITRASNVDGPGFRTTVFFKGCPLQCEWCHNPETQRSGIELMYDDRKCIEECDLCLKVHSRVLIFAASYLEGKLSFFQKLTFYLKVCEYDAILPGDVGRIDRDACSLCLKCVEECPTEAIEKVGTEYTVEGLMKQIRKDKLVMQNSQGGTTFSGGEPLFQNTAFIVELLKKCKEEGIHTALDTCGALPWEIFEEVIPHTSMFLYDVKHTNHKMVKSDLALENLRKLAATGAKMWIRIPFIPGFNAYEEEVKNIGEFIKSIKCDNIERINLLPFHRLPEAKYDMLNREWKLTNLPEQKGDETEHWREILSEICGYEVIIGG